MSTLSEILTDVRSQINQTDSSNSDYTDVELTEFINQAIRFTGSKILYPRTSTTVSPTAGTKTYSLPSDFMNLLIAYYGDTAVNGSVRKLKIITHERLAAMYPGWLENVSDNQGRPEYLMLLNRTQFVLFPAPDTTNAASNNLVHMYYNNYPAEITTGTESPDLPSPFHDIIAVYVAHLCYGGKLQNPQLSTAKLNEFTAKMKLLELPTTQEAFQWRFEWGNADNLSFGPGGVIIP